MPNQQRATDALTPEERRVIKRDLFDLVDTVSETEAEFAELLNDWQTFPDTTPLPEQIAAIKQRAAHVARLHAFCIDSYKHLIRHPEYRTVEKTTYIDRSGDFLVGIVGVGVFVVIGLLGTIACLLAW